MSAVAAVGYRNIVVAGRRKSMPITDGEVPSFHKAKVSSIVLVQDGTMCSFPGNLPEVGPGRLPDRWCSRTGCGEDMLVRSLWRASGLNDGVMGIQ